MNRAWVALGSNLNKEENLPDAARLLAQSCRLLAVSSVYETTPVGTTNQPNFLNAAVLVETELDPAAFKEQLLAEIERSLKRKRTADKNAPRTIDADLILFNDEVFTLGHRHIPDPDLLRFVHVAVPIAELTPDLLHPETGEPLAAIAQRLLEAAGHDQIIWQRRDIALTQNINVKPK